MSRSSLLFDGCQIPYVEPARRRACVNHITDGDTLWVEVDVGYRHSQLIELRLVGPEYAGVNAPERFTSEGKLSTQFVEQWTGGKGSFVEISTAQDTEKYGRWLAVVWKGDKDLASDLVTAGLAKWQKY